MKKSISVSNLTLGLWLDYVRPALRAADLLKEVPARDDWHEFTAEVIEETAADEIAHCMYCACIGIGDGVERTHEEYIRHEAERMVYQLEVSIKYDLRHVADTLAALLAALTATLNPADTTTTEEEDEEQTMKPEVIFNRIRQEVEARTERSAWGRGVTDYALELVDELEEATKGGYFDLSDLEAPKLIDRQLLNGAADWNQYSWGGCSLCYDCQIAERLCTPSELKRTRGGERRPNSREEWLDTQARALFQASNRVKRSIRAALEAQDAPTLAPSTAACVW